MLMVARIDFILLPILMLAFFALQMDRGNISNALTSTITTDLGVNTNKINVGSSLLSLGIVLLELPSNILLQKVSSLNLGSGSSLLTVLGWPPTMAFRADLCMGTGGIVSKLYHNIRWIPRHENSSWPV